MGNKKNKVNIYKWKLAILAFLIVLLVAVSFWGGVITSCENGYLKGIKCIQPEKVATVSVCEYNPITCAANCKNALINDVDAFCNQYNTDILE